MKKETYQYYKDYHTKLGLSNLYEFEGNISLLSNKEINDFRDHILNELSDEDVHYIVFKSGCAWSKFTGLMYDDKGNVIQ